MEFYNIDIITPIEAAPKKKDFHETVAAPYSVRSDKTSVARMIIMINFLAKWAIKRTYSILTRGIAEFPTHIYR